MINIKVKPEEKVQMLLNGYATLAVCLLMVQEYTKGVSTSIFLF